MLNTQLRKTAVHDYLHLNRLKEFIKQSVSRQVAGVFGLDECNRMYLEMDRPQDAGRFAESALRELGVGWSVTGLDNSDMPRQGATVVVSNHPFGGIEGLILIALLRRLRQDVKVLANPFLWRIPELREVLIPIDPYNTKQACRNNIKSLREAFGWLADGGLLVVFPAGEVSHFHLRSRAVTDPAWQQGVCRLIAHSKAVVVPVYFPGSNGIGFQVAGMLHPRLRTLLLARQLLNKRGQLLEMRVGQRVTAHRLRQMGTAQEQLNYLRLRTYLLASKEGEENRSNGSADKLASTAESPLACPVPASHLQMEVKSLPPESLMFESGGKQVFCITAEQAPSVLREIGRLRELTFRQHGEGTGRSLDLDRFDAHYQHLFLWETERQEIMGAYRIGQTDRILYDHGLGGLYSSTLFKIKPRLFEELPAALEMGRSFVRPEYQKSFAPLLMLWQGIGRYLVRHPQYRVLFGPVSISRDYSDFSRQLMTRTLQEQLGLPDLSRYVEPRVPVNNRLPRVKGCRSDLTRAFTRNIEMMSALVADVDADLNGIPVLIRQYLNLGGKILAFNLDPDFSHVIDGLIMVDLDRSEEKSLVRYMGKDGLAEFHARQDRAA